MRTYFPWNSEDIFLKNRGKVVCDTTENERESTIPLLNMDISNLSDGKSEDGVAKSKHVNGFTSPSAQSVIHTMVAFRQSQRHRLTPKD